MVDERMTTGQEVVHKIGAAQQLLLEARNTATSKNTLANNVPEITRLAEIGKELTTLMQKISRMQL